LLVLVDEAVCMSETMIGQLMQDEICGQ